MYVFTFYYKPAIFIGVNMATWLKRGMQCLCWTPFGWLIPLTIPSGGGNGDAVRYEKSILSGTPPQNKYTECASSIFGRWNPQLNGQRSKTWSNLYYSVMGTLFMQYFILLLLLHTKKYEWKFQFRNCVYTSTIPNQIM